MKRLFVCWLILFAAHAGRADAGYIPTDPFYAPRQAGYAADLGLPEAWDRTLGSSSVIVAVLDTGVVRTTAELTGRLLDPQSTTGTAPFADSTLIGTANLHHGTYIATAIGMGISNGRGGAGMGEFTILPITVTNSNGNNSSANIAAAIRLAADEGARVINVSHSTLSYGPLESAAAYARTKGALTFIAAGNTNLRIDRGNFPNLIFVGGLNADGTRWQAGSQGSTWGPFVDLAMPAHEILAADASAVEQYVIVSGTSLATSLASGAAALAWSLNPTLTPEQVESLLYSTATDLGDPGKDELFGHGRINVDAFLTAVVAVPEPATLAPSLVALALLSAKAIGRWRTTRQWRRSVAT